VTIGSTASIVPPSESADRAPVGLVASGVDQDDVMAASSIGGMTLFDIGD
jgi:hypothetical protein